MWGVGNLESTVSSAVFASCFNRKSSVFWHAQICQIAQKISSPLYIPWKFKLCTLEALKLLSLLFPVMNLLTKHSLMRHRRTWAAHMPSEGHFYPKQEAMIAICVYVDTARNKNQHITPVWMSQIGAESSNRRVYEKHFHSAPPFTPNICLHLILANETGWNRFVGEEFIFPLQTAISMWPNAESGSDV